MSIIYELTCIKILKTVPDIYGKFFQLFTFYSWLLALCCFIPSLIISVCVLNLYAPNFWRSSSLRYMLNLLTSTSWRCLTSRWWPRSWPGEQVLPSGHWQTAGKYEFSALVNISPLLSGRKSSGCVLMLFFSFTLNTNEAFWKISKYLKEYGIHT